MSGGKGGDYTPIGPPDRCEKLKVETALQSPNPDVVGKLRKSDVLQLQLEPVGDRHAVLVLKDTEVAGSLVFPSLQRLVECMQAGHIFVAEVVSISGPACRLQVRTQ